MKLSKLAGAPLAALALAGLASAQVTLPDLGVDVPGTATAMGTDLGTIFMAILAISAVFIAGSIGWRWLRRAKA
ncbi:MAG: hypothetical protein AAFQ53_15765 [Bacteroidota bacterium]